MQGGYAPIPLEDFEQKYWNWAIDLNLKGTYICTQAVIKYMKRQQGGKIVNISSQAGRSKSELSNLAYASAKAGVLGFTRQLAHEVGQFGINVNAIAPGIIERMDKRVAGREYRRREAKNVGSYSFKTTWEARGNRPSSCFLSIGEIKLHHRGNYRR